MELMQASRQWSSRPDDQRFISLLDLHEHVAASRKNSVAKVISSRQITVRPHQNDELNGIEIIGPNGGPVVPTHWAFGQLCQRAGAPAKYMRQLPAPMVSDCINYGMHVARNVEDVGAMLHRNGGEPELRALTGPNYGRIWCESISGALIDRFGDGREGQWTVPGEFGKAVEVTKENTTLYASDRDMWIFLADEKNRIEIPNRRDGKSGSLARGFFLWNSEVGAESLGLATFLFDYACCNRIVWGAQQYKEIRVRHTSGAPDRWLEEVTPVLTAYSESSGAEVIDMVKVAQTTKIDKTKEFLRKRYGFTSAQENAIQDAHMTEEGRPIETLWDAATGITAYARGLKHQDSRVAIERVGGKVLELAR